MSIYKLPGSAIESNTITITQIQTTAVTNIVTQSGPRVSSLIYPGNDTAGNTVGGQTVYINGSGFETNNAIYINGNAVPSKTFISASNLSFTTPALAAGIYPVYIINTDSGSTAIFIPGYISSAEPAWVTSAGSLNESQDELSAWSYSLSATGDAPITYALAGGSSLPTGVSLAANGLISGTITSPSGNTTTYTFSVIATDAQNQDSTRQFTATTTTGEGVLFANNVLLIHADGTNNQNNHTFLDSSNNNFTITRNGNATQGTFSPFSQTGWSGYFDGTGDYLALANNAAFGFGSGDFTMECWFYKTTNNLDVLIDTRVGATGATGVALYVQSNTLKVSNNAELLSGGTVVSNSWNHCAVVRSGNDLYLYLNGTRTANAAFSTTLAVSSSPYIGNSGSSEYTGGYLASVRILKGTAQYTGSTYTVPTAALTNIANTSLLTLQSNRFIDNSNNNFTITRNGDTSIQAFSPFAPTAAYSTANVGGSGYFDGTGDYLTVADNTALDMGSSDFTIEGWYYPTTSSATASSAILSKRANSSAVGGVLLYFSSSSLAPELLVDIGGSWTVIAASSIAFTSNQWNHFAIARNGSAFRVYINGALGASGTNSGSIPDNAAAFAIGAMGENGSGAINASYISNFRVVKGTAVYTAAFTPPTAPLTNIANTSLLCNFTNAGIFDQTAKTVLETVGDAKVSTAQYKYGTGSMVFDGSGDYLVINQSNLLLFGTAPFTIEFWFKTTSSTRYAQLIGNEVSTNGFTILINVENSTDGKIAVYNGASGQIHLSSSGYRDDTWYHLALSRNSSGSRLFINGTQIGSTSSGSASTSFDASPLRIAIGANLQNGSRDYSGYIDDLRITKGYARYTSTFTPPTSALKDK